MQTESHDEQNMKSVIELLSAVLRIPGLLVFRRINTALLQAQIYLRSGSEKYGDRDYDQARTFCDLALIELSYARRLYLKWQGWFSESDCGRVMTYLNLGKLTHMLAGECTIKSRQLARLDIDMDSTTESSRRDVIVNMMKAGIAALGNLAELAGQLRVIISFQHGIDPSDLTLANLAIMVEAIDRSRVADIQHFLALLRSYSCD